MRIEYLLIILILYIALPTSFLGQARITKESIQDWNPQLQKWSNRLIKTWKFDAQGRENEYTEEWDFQDSNTSESQISKMFFYNENGDLILENRTDKIDTVVTRHRTDRFYDTENRLIEIKYATKYVGIDTFVTTNRFLFLFEDGGKKRIIKELRVENNFGSMWLDVYRESRYNEQGCEVGFVYRKYKSTTPHNRELSTYIEMTYDTNCKLLVHTRIDTNSSPYGTSKFRQKHSYVNGGEIKKIAYEKFDSLAGWSPAAFREIYYDDKSREIRNYFQSVLVGSEVEQLKTVLFSDEGRHLSTHFFRDGNLRLLDTLTYSFNAENQLIRKHSARIFYDPSSSSSITTKYTYLCNGLLGIKIEDNLPTVSKTTYEYDTFFDCQLEKGEETLTVFPNPTSGWIEIESNLFSGENSFISILAPDGREVYRNHFKQSTDRLQVNLTGFSPGNYYLFIQNGKRSASKRILISN